MNQTAPARTGSEIKEEKEMKHGKLLTWALVLVMLLSAALPALGEDVIWRKGDTGEEVRLIQDRLAELGYLTGDASGIFDDATEAAVKDFQTWNDLLETGMVDGVTWTVLFSDGARAPIAAWSAENDWGYPLTEEGCAYEVPAEAKMSGMYAMATGMPNAMGSGADRWNTDEYTFIRENGFQSAATAPLSTFAADVDTASYAQVRARILAGQAVPADAVRVEEMLNYFHYDYQDPTGNDPFGVTMELAPCPWNPDTLLLQIGLQARTIKTQDRPRHNLVFLIDVSGSMFGSDRLDLVKRAFLMLLDELAPTDTVSIVTYASRDQVLLSGVPAADKVRIMEAISGLEARGSTNSAAGIQTAYQIAEQNASEGSVNRIIMATDGDFNVGMTSEGDLARLVMEKKAAGVRLTMLGVGYGNYKDNKLEALADYGDGNYYYLDSVFEARRALVSEAGGTLIEVARDVKLQLDFNPARVQAYRLIGYEDRLMAAEDFADDAKDGGEIGSGHRVTVLYEIVPVGSGMRIDAPQSKYQAGGTNESEEWLTLSVRAKMPGRQDSDLFTYPLAGEAAETLSDNMKFAAAVAEAAMLLRDSEWKGASSYAQALALVRDCQAVTGDPYKEEFVYLLTLLERQAAMECGMP